MAAVSMSSTTTSTATRPLRLLCLHGWRTNGALMELQTRQLRGQFEEGEVELTHLNAPHVSPGPAFPGAERLVDGPFFEWWDTIEVGGSGDVAYGFSSDASAVEYRGLCESLDYLSGYLRDDYYGPPGHEVAEEERIPFDAIVGFSQGGIMTSILTVLLEQQRRRASKEEEEEEEVRGGREGGRGTVGGDWLAGTGKVVPDFKAAWKAVVLVSTMMPRDTRLTTTTTTSGGGGGGDGRSLLMMGSPSLEMPAVHVWGEADSMAPKSRELADWWNKDGGRSSRAACPVIIHAAGHKFPPGNRNGEYSQIKDALLFHCRGTRSAY